MSKGKAYTKEEEDLIISLHSKGNMTWADIAKPLNRTAKGVRLHYDKFLKPKPDNLPLANKLSASLSDSAKNRNDGGKIIMPADKYCRDDLYNILIGCGYTVKISLNNAENTILIDFWKE